MMLARPASSLRCLARTAAIHARLPPSSIAVISSRRHLLPLVALPQSSPFSTTPAHLKKGGKKGKQSAPNDDDDDTPSPSSSKEVFDFNTHHDSVSTSLTKLLTKLKDDLSRLRSSATNDTTLPITQLESLPIDLEPSPTPTTPLRDLAHITPSPSSRRTLLITIHSPPHTKKILRAITKSHLDFHPTVTDPVSAPNILSIPLPPPTKEGREKLAEQATKLGERVKGEIRLVRQEGMKKLKGLGKGGKGIKVDEVKKEEGRLEKLVKGVEEEVKKAVDGVRKGILEN